MSVISLETFIAAPRERVFDLARNLEAHQDTTRSTQESAVAGTTFGLLGLHETVTWEARHLGVRQRLTVRMTRLDRPSSFQDVMLEGPFHHFVHDHSFESHAGTQR